MPYHDRTDIGGKNAAFESTQWSLILDARTMCPERRREAVGAIMERYWKPVYAYLRRQGKGNEEAKDLAQGFFHEIVLGRELVQKADREQGRFRSFLLTALDRYTRSVHRHDSAMKRRPQNGWVRLDSPDVPDVPDRATPSSPDEAFTYTWACQLLYEVLESVKSDCQRAGMKKHWLAFQRTVVEPILEGVPKPSLAQVAAELDVAGDMKVSNMAITVKRRFKAALVGTIRQSVGTDDEVAQEIVELVAILSRIGAEEGPAPRTGG